MPYVTAVPGVRLFSSCCKQSPLASSFSIMEKEPAQVRLHANWTVTRTASVVVEFCEAYSRLEHVFMWRITVTNGLTSPLDVIKYQNIHEKDILHLTASLNWTDTFLFVCLFLWRKRASTWDESFSLTLLHRHVASLAGLLFMVIYFILLVLLLSPVTPMSVVTSLQAFNMPAIIIGRVGLHTSHTWF